MRIEAADSLSEPGITITREEFLIDPIRLMWQHDVQLEWIMEAYRTNKEFRNNVWYGLSRSVTKRGNFSLAGGWLQIFSSILEEDEVTTLYEAIRQGSQRLELEWRPEFVEAFPHCRDVLPKVDFEEIKCYWEQTLFHAIWDRDLSQVKQAVEELRRAGIPLNSLEKLAPEALEDGEVAYQSDGLSLRETAARLEEQEIEEYLRAAGME